MLLRMGIRGRNPLVDDYMLVDVLPCTLHGTRVIQRGASDWNWIMSGQLSWTCLDSRKGSDISWRCTGKFGNVPWDHAEPFFEWLTAFH